MANFRVKGKKYDGVYCTVDTFRHLLTEKQAEQHLHNVSKTLKKNGLYIIGLHLTTKQKISGKVIRWTAKRGRLTVNSSMSMLDLDKKKRLETLKVVLGIKTIGDRLKSVPEKKYESVYKLRTYSLKQFYRLLSNTNVFEVMNVYDYNYDLSNTLIPHKMLDYGVFVLKKV